MSEYKQVSSATAYPKKGKVSKQGKKQRHIKTVVLEDGLYGTADISKVPASERTVATNQYYKVPSDRKKYGPEDKMAAEMRTNTYNGGKFGRSK